MHWNRIKATLCKTRLIDMQSNSFYIFYHTIFMQNETSPIVDPFEDAGPLIETDAQAHAIARTREIASARRDQLQKEPFDAGKFWHLYSNQPNPLSPTGIEQLEHEYYVMHPGIVTLQQFVDYKHMIDMTTDY